MVKTAKGKNQIFVSVTDDLSEFLNEDFLSNIVGKFLTIFDKTDEPSTTWSIINVVILTKYDFNVLNLIY